MIPEPYKSWPVVMSRNKAAQLLRGGDAIEGR